MKRDELCPVEEKVGGGLFCGAGDQAVGFPQAGKRREELLF